MRELFGFLVSGTMLLVAGESQAQSTDCGIDCCGEECGYIDLVPGSPNAELLSETETRWVWELTLPTGEQETLTLLKPVTRCPADITTEGTEPGDVLFGAGDGLISEDDLDLYQSLFSALDPMADLSTAGAVEDDPEWGVSDGLVTPDDLLYFLAEFEETCPQEKDPIPLGDPLQLGGNAVLANSCNFGLSQDPGTNSELNLAIDIYSATDICDSGDPQWIVDPHLQVGFFVSFGAAASTPQVVGTMKFHESLPPEGPPGDKWFITAYVRVDFKVGLFLPVNLPFMGIGKEFSRIYYCSAGVCCCLQ